MKRYRIGVVTVPIFKSGNPPLANLLDILLPHSKDLFLITGNDGFRFFRDDTRFQVDGWIYSDAGRSVSVRLLHYIWTQFAISSRLVVRRKDVDIWIFFFGYYRLILPILIAKLFNKRVLLLLPDPFGRLSGMQNDQMSLLMHVPLKLTYTLTDRIVVYSPRFIEGWGLERYQQKILIGHEHYLDTDTFRITSSFCYRSKVIGFVGRFSSEKGIREFVRALPILLAKCSDLTVLLGGDGPLKDEIEKYLIEQHLSDRVELTGWISHDNLPEFLNRLRLLVLPSYTEGLPNIVLEAMACGIPVLATPVGAIPDIIHESKTGFIMETNSPECIAENIIRVLASPELNRIAENGRSFVKVNYTFEKTVATWGKILEEAEQDSI